MDGRRGRGSCKEISSEENEERERERQPPSEIALAIKSDTSEDEQMAEREDDDEDVAYSPLADNAGGEQLGHSGYCCEESLALLPHEMRCCSESGTDTDSSDSDCDCDISKAACQKLDGSLEYGLQQPYQLMHNAEECAKDGRRQQLNDWHVAGVAQLNSQHK
ncbi:uncharacterized protein DMAD_02095 [Drosophila madeirensis]|uniref:Uncharacterized protein n=1 Tax=Drosophila madeirensis TaxID=30013 RepID=A0AAU9G505_DROMD